MNALLISIAVATLGIDYGWERLPEGGMLYIIQLKPEELDSLRAGQRLESDVPRAAGEVRSYRIVVGRGLLPHDAPPPSVTPPEKALPVASRVAEPALPTIIAPNAKPLSGERASFEEPAKPATDNPQSKPAAKPAPQEPAKPWLPLTLTLFGLFGSVGANAYLGWIVLELRQRCRAN
jgi:hypothetical protein